MIDYKTFKKGFLHEWVDKSQAARKAAEELAMKEVRPSLRDLHKNDFNEELVFFLDGHRVEFKDENEKKTDGDTYFTYDEAMKCFGEPDLKEGWRLPTEEEFKALCNCPYEFKDEQGVFDNRLYLPAAGYRYRGGNVEDMGFSGSYWSSTPKDSDRAWDFGVFSGGVDMSSDYWCYGLSVRLVRDL